MKTAIETMICLNILDETAKQMNLTRITLIEREILVYQDKIDEMIGDKIHDKIKAGKKTIPYE